MNYLKENSIMMGQQRQMHGLCTSCKFLESLGHIQVVLVVVFYAHFYPVSACFDISLLAISLCIHLSWSVNGDPHSSQVKCFIGPEVMRGNVMHTVARFIDWSF